MSFPVKLFSSLASMFTLENLFEEGSDRYYVVKDAIESISETFEKNVSEPVSAYWDRMPEQIVKPLFLSMIPSFVLGYFLGVDITNLDMSPEAQYADTIKGLSAGLESVLFAGALCLVNAAVRPIFDQYFPRNWNTLRLFAEVAVTVTLVGIPAYFLCAGSLISTAKLTHLIVFSSLTRLALGVIPQQDDTKIPEGSTVEYQKSASVWFSFYIDPLLSLR